jgi:arylsulfatase A-like enzyme
MTPDHEHGPAGPFSHWPPAWGFDKFWGFLSGASGQWDPLISLDNETIGTALRRSSVAGTPAHGVHGRDERSRPGTIRRVERPDVDPPTRSRRGRPTCGNRSYEDSTCKRE